MNVKKKKRAIFTCAQGFSLIEALFAMAATLVILAASVGIFKSVTDMGDSAMQVADVSQDIQVSLNLIRRDLQKTGKISGLGIPLPFTGVDPNPWKGNRWCNGTGCSGTNGTTLLIAGVPGETRGFPANTVVFDAVTPGKISNGSDDTDAISIFYEDDFAINIDVVGMVPNSIRLDPNLMTSKNSAKFAAIRPGDFILLQGATESILQHVAGVTFNSGIENPYTEIKLNNPIELGFNQSMSFLGGEEIRATLLRRVTYYLERDDDNDTVWLMRQVNVRPAVRIISGIKEFSLTYDDGNPSGEGTQFVERFIGAADAGMGAGYFTDNPDKIKDIRRVNVSITTNTERHQNSRNTVESTQTAQIAVRRSADSIFGTADEAEGITTLGINGPSVIETDEDGDSFHQYDAIINGLEGDLYDNDQVIWTIRINEYYPFTGMGNVTLDESGGIRVTGFALGQAILTVEDPVSGLSASMNILFSKVT